MNPSKRAYLLFKELGLSQLVPFALYRTQLRNGSLQKQVSPPCPTLIDPWQALEGTFLFNLSSIPDERKLPAILKAADEIVAGSFHPFSGEITPLDLSLSFSPLPLQHWTGYSDQVNEHDIKTIWEPARFSWVIPLCQAYRIQADDQYARTFWHNLELFLVANPESQGPNWVSAQEVALRFIPWLLAAQTFHQSPESTPERLQKLIQAIWQSTARIALTLNYSRSQNNNHLLSEALGLMLGGQVFRETSIGKKWLILGLHEFQNGILSQVEADGTYSQHSTNYHRLMLHLALLAEKTAFIAGHPFSKQVKERLAQATRWLLTQLDETSGRVPNLGHNDGSNLLPFGCSDYLDYRATAQAASLAFLSAPCLPAGPWDELPSWLGLGTSDAAPLQLDQIGSRAIYRVGNASTWATLRSVQFHSRPAHADLLHVDLWHQGINLLADAGTYAYNLAEPWQNRLSSTLVHNTVNVADQDQMLRDGKFLWLERARAFALPAQPNLKAAILYCNLPIAYTQVRTLTWIPGLGFNILDQIELARLEKSAQPVSIQFLLPDWSWQFVEDTLQLTEENQHFSIHISATDPADHSKVTGTASLVRAGEPLLGTLTNPTRGWISPTYLVKKPALSFMVTFASTKTLEINTELKL